MAAMSKATRTVEQCMLCIAVRPYCEEEGVVRRELTKWHFTDSHRSLLLPHV
jgi:hypothetical protein